MNILVRSAGASPTTTYPAPANKINRLLSLLVRWAKPQRMITPATMSSPVATKPTFMTTCSGEQTSRRSSPHEPHVILPRSLMLFADQLYGTRHPDPATSCAVKKSGGGAIQAKAPAALRTVVPRLVVGGGLGGRLMAEMASRDDLRAVANHCRRNPFIRSLLATGDGCSRLST